MMIIANTVSALNITIPLVQEAERRQGVFEIHFAVPEISGTAEKLILNEFEKIGIVKNKYFLRVFNVSPHSDYCFPIDVPPTGHDLPNPLFMSTTITSSFTRASELVKNGMSILRSQGISGNFEIEMVLGENIQEMEIQAELEFPEFKRIEDSPKFENHLVFRGTQATLPSFDKIIEAFRQHLGMNIHQIVDFSTSRKNDVEQHTRISRVATIYQPTKHSAFELATEIKVLSGFLEYDALITEQVCLVAEYK